MPIIFLNGASSSGKTSIAKELQNLFTEPYLNAGVDSFFKMVPKRFITAKGPNALFEWLETSKNKSPCLTLKLHPWGEQLIMGMYNAIASLARSGNNIITDEIAINKEVLRHGAEILSPFKVYFIGVKCPQEILEKREVLRKNQPTNSARGQYQLVHDHGDYDFEVDTSLMSPLECAVKIKRYIEKNTNPTCFKKLIEQKGNTYGL